MSTEHKTGKPHDAGSLSGTQDILLSRVRSKLNRVEEMQENVRQSLVLADRDAAMYLKDANERRMQMPLDTTHMYLMTALSSTSTSVNGSCSPFSACG